MPARDCGGDGNKYVVIDEDEQHSRESAEDDAAEPDEAQEHR